MREIPERLVCCRFLFAHLRNCNLGTSAGTQGKQGNNDHCEYDRPCRRYFAVLAQCLRNGDPSDKLIKTIEQQSQRTLEIAFAFSQTVGVKPEAWAAKTKYTLKRHMDRMNNDCLNISVLFEPYTEQCKRLVANPDMVLSHAEPRS
jgi:hypothetical protein